MTQNPKKNELMQGSLVALPRLPDTKLKIFVTQGPSAALPIIFEIQTKQLV